MEGALGAFLAIPEALVLGGIATGTGRRICRRLLPDSSGLEQSAFGFPVGMALLSLLTTALLFARMPAAGLPWALGAALAGAALWARKDAATVARELRGFARGSPALAALVSASALLGMIGCLAPETGWDTGVYHFALSRQWAEQGAAIVRKDVPHSFHPAYLESLHAAGFLLNGEALASLLNGSYYFAGLALVRLWGIRVAGPGAGGLAALAWMTSVTFVLRLDGGDTEVAQAVYLTVGLLSLLRLRDGGSPGWAVLAGGSLGFLAGLKYPSLFMIAAVATAWGLIRLRDRAPFRVLLTDAAVIGGLALVVACPWYVRNKAETGHPLYPYGRPAAPAEAPVAEEPPPRSAVVAHLFKVLAMDGLALAALPALLLAATSRDRWCAALPFLVAPCMFKLLGFNDKSISNALRYTSPCWVPLLVFGGVGVRWALDRSAAGGRLALAALIAAVGAGQGVLALRNLPKLPVVLGLVSREEYLGRRVSTYRAIREAEAGLPAGKKILLVEERGYYCRAPYLAADDHQEVVDFRKMSSALDVRRFLDAESIGAIVVDRGPGAKIWKYRDLERRLGADWPPPGVRAVTIPGDASLYRVD